MLKFVLKQLGYGHLLTPKKEVHTRRFGFHTSAPNAAVMALINEDLSVDFNPHDPISDFLPFTPTEYILGGLLWALEERPISSTIAKVSPTIKFTAKTLIDIPSAPMFDLEFINVIQNAMKFVNACDKYRMYVALPHSDVVLSSNTGRNFNKTLNDNSIPLKIIRSINTLHLTCDVEGEHYVGHYFTYKFARQNERWSLVAITTDKAWDILSPVELLMYAWSMMLKDIDYLCNRKPKFIAGTSIQENSYHLGLRTRYDISEGLAKVVQIIDSELSQDRPDAKLLQTIIADNDIHLSSNILDFTHAVEVLRKEGTERKIYL